MNEVLFKSDVFDRQNSVPVHTRLLVAFVMIFAIVLSESLLAFLGYLVLVLCLWKQSSLSLTPGLKRLMLIDSLILLTILPLPFSYINDQLIYLGSFALSQAGVTKAIEVFIKATLSAVIMMSQCNGVSELELSKALFTLRVPTRFILLLQFSIRYISVMHQELFRLRMAMRARGLGKGNLWHNWKSYGYLFGMLFVKALARADRIWFAMKCRGYCGYFPVTSGIRDRKIMNRFAWLYISAVLLILVAEWTNLMLAFWIK